MSTPHKGELDAPSFFSLIPLVIWTLTGGAFALDASSATLLLSAVDGLSTEWDMAAVDFQVTPDTASDTISEVLNLEIEKRSGNVANTVEFRVCQDLADSAPARDLMIVVTEEEWEPPEGILNGTWMLPHSSQLDPMNLRYDSMVFLYQINGSSSVIITEAYVFKHGSSVIRRQEVGYWNDNIKDFVYTTEENVWERRSDLEGETVVGVYNAWAPLSYFLPDETLGGAFVDVAQVFADSMNFSLVIEKQADGKWGSKREDGSWSGMMGSLVEKRADLALSGLRITQSRKNAIDFVDAPYQILITLMAHDNSKKRAIVLTRYFEAYSLGGWISIGVLSLMLSFVVHASFQLPVLKKPSREIKVTEFTYFESLSLVVYMVLFQRDYPFEPNPNNSSRLSFFITCLFGYVFFAGYAALLTATMIGSNSELQIETLEDLAASDVHLYLWEDSSTYDSFQLADPSSARGLVYRTKIEGKLEDVFISSNDEIHQKLAANPDSVFLDWDIILAGYPDMYAVRSFRDFTPAQVSIGLQKESEYREAFNYHLRKMDQTGIRYCTVLML